MGSKPLDGVRIRGSSARNRNMKAIRITLMLGLVCSCVLLSGQSRSMTSKRSMRPGPAAGHEEEYRKEKEAREDRYGRRRGPEKEKPPRFDLRQLMKRLRSKNAEEKAFAVYYLREHKEKAAPAIPDLIEMLRSSEAIMLTEGAESSLASFRKISKSQAQRERSVVGRLERHALARKHFPSQGRGYIVPSVTRYPYLGEMASKTLVEIGEPAVRPLRASLSSMDKDTKKLALRALREIPQVMKKRERERELKERREEEEERRTAELRKMYFGPWYSRWASSENTSVGEIAVDVEKARDSVELMQMAAIGGPPFVRHLTQLLETPVAVSDKRALFKNTCLLLGAIGDMAALRPLKSVLEKLDRRPPGEKESRLDQMAMRENVEGALWKIHFDRNAPVLNQEQWAGALRKHKQAPLEIRLRQSFRSVVQEYGRNYLIEDWFPEKTDHLFVHPKTVVYPELSLRLGFTRANSPIISQIEIWADREVDQEPQRDTPRRIDGRVRRGAPPRADRGIWKDTTIRNSGLGLKVYLCSSAAKVIELYGARSDTQLPQPAQTEWSISFPASLEEKRLAMASSRSSLVTVQLSLRDGALIKISMTDEALVSSSTDQIPTTMASKLEK